MGFSCSRVVLIRDVIPSVVLIKWFLILCLHVSQLFLHTRVDRFQCFALCYGTYFLILCLLMCLFVSWFHARMLIDFSALHCVIVYWSND